MVDDYIKKLCPYMLTRKKDEILDTVYVGYVCGADPERKICVGVEKGRWFDPASKSDSIDLDLLGDCKLRFAVLDSCLSANDCFK